MVAAITPDGHGLGRIPDLGDIRDNRPLFLARYPHALPTSVDMRSDLPAPQDQGDLGSCTAWASLAAWRHARKVQGLPDEDGSELAQYYWTREGMRTTHEDSGASIRDAIKTMAKRGVAPESLWPYRPQFYQDRPAPPVRAAAIQAQVLEYASVGQSVDELRIVLSQNHVVVFGISVYESFEGDHNGVIPMPATTEKLLGGHAIALVGYDDAEDRFIFRNSWGSDWGDGGYGWLLYDYVVNPDLASDFWVLNRLEA